MIAHPPNLALVVIAIIGALMTGWAALFAIRLLRHWNLASGASAQIALEKRTYLVSAIMGYVAAAQMAALALFVFNADRMAKMFAGAMCAVGALNASAFGFPALYAKLALFFLGAVWLALNAANGKARDWPLLRPVYGLIVVVALLSAMDAALTLAYFLDLSADTVTSCCGKTFAPEKESLGGDMAALPPLASLILLYGSLGGAIAFALWARSRAAQLAYGVASAALFVVAIAAIVSVISLYVYEHPHHHCPFCLLKREYGYFGFALYAPLFLGTATGLAAGVLSIWTPPTLATTLPALRRRFVLVSAAGFAAFGALAALAVARSGLILIG